MLLHGHMASQQIQDSCDYPLFKSLRSFAQPVIGAARATCNHSSIGTCTCLGDLLNANEESRPLEVQLVPEQRCCMWPPVQQQKPHRLHEAMATILERPLLPVVK